MRRLSRLRRGGTVGLLDIILIGIALSADAFAVTISNMFCYPGLSRGKQLSMPISFGIFQGLMPILGFFLGSLIGGFIERFAGPITFVVLGFIGGKMIWDTVKELRAAKRGEAGDAEDTASDKDFGFGTLMAQSVATAIDAFAVGVSFCAEGVAIWGSAAIITVCTFLCCLVALAIGRRFGVKLGDKAQLIGGVVLVAIGLKALIL